jgi:hypothetical protein
VVVFCSQLTHARDQVSDLDRQVEMLLLRLRRAAAPTKEFEGLAEAEERLRDARARVRSATEASQVQLQRTI